MDVRTSFLQALKGFHLSKNEEPKGRLDRFITYSLRYCFHIARELIRDQCLLRASALTFTTLMTLIPVAVLLFISFRAVGGLEEASIQIKLYLFQHLLPESVASVQGYIENLVSDFNAQAVSYVSLLFLSAAVYGLFSSIDSSLNVIWRGHHPRNIINRIVNTWFILSVAPILLAYSLYLTAQLETRTTFSVGIIAARAVSRLTPYILTLITFTLMYKLVPRTVVQWKAAILGSVFSAFFWEVSKYGFNYYVKNLSNLKLLYGSFLTLPVFLIWINLSWLIILTGAEIAYTFQNLEFLHITRQQDERIRKEMFFLSEKLGIMIVCSVFERYINGYPVTLSQLSRQSPGSGWMLDTYLEHFRKHDLIVLGDNGTVIPARDPSTIQVNELLDLFGDQRSDRLKESGEAETAERLLEDLEYLRRKSFDGLDFRTFIENIAQRRSTSGLNSASGSGVT